MQLRVFGDEIRALLDGSFQINGHFPFMETIKSLSDAVRIIHFFIAEKRGWENVKKKRNMICWRDEANGMIGPRRIWITEYSKDVYRIKAGMAGEFIKGVWPFEVPRQERFELTLHSSEITREYVNDLIPVVASSYNQFKDVPKIHIFDDVKGFPCYSWSKKATVVYEAHRKALDSRSPRTS